MSVTAKEKLRKDHPHWDDSEFERRLRYDCPENYGYLDTPVWCIAEGDCNKCWDREIPSDDKKLKDIVAEALSLNRELGEAELNEAIEELKKEFGESKSSNKLGSIELGIEVHQCRDCDRGRNVLYLCDGKACGGICPNPECKHTTDIRFAKNFKSATELFMNGYCVSSTSRHFMWFEPIFQRVFGEIRILLRPLRSFFDRLVVDFPERITLTDGTKPMEEFE